MDKITYKFIIEAIITPIKEAVLTYIIFDTVKNEEKKEFNVKGEWRKKMTGNNISKKRLLGVRPRG